MEVLKFCDMGKNVQYRVRKMIILMVPDPRIQRASHPGGQLTAAKGIIEQIELKGLEYKVIDTYQSNFPKPSIIIKSYQSILRLIILFTYLFRYKVDGVVIFAAGGFSFYEKMMYCFASTLFKTKSFLFIRSGHFMTNINNASSLKRTFVKKLLKVPNFIGAQGNSWLEFYKGLGLNNEKVKVIRNWLPSDYEITSTPIKLGSSSVVKFIFVGWVVEKKGILELIAAFDSSDVLKRDAELVVVGGGDLFDRCKKELKENKISNIELKGWLQPKEVASELTKSHVFVLPSYAEGFPNSILEAFAKALPVITTPVGAIPDSVIDNENGLIVDVGSIKQLQTALEYFVLNKDKIEKMSVNNISAIKQKHDRISNCEKLLDIFIDKK